jgi:hypothetical protein
LEINTYPRRIRRSSNLGNIFRGKIASYRPENTVYTVNRNTNWIGHMLLRNGLPKQVIERNTEG